MEVHKRISKKLFNEKLDTFIQNSQEKTIGNNRKKGGSFII